MENDLRDVDHQPGDPAVPFLEGRQELRREDQDRHAAVQVRGGIGGEKRPHHPSPEERDDQDGGNGKAPLSPGQHAYFQFVCILRRAFLLLRMRPAPVPIHIDGEGNGLEQQVRVQAPVPEQEEQGGGVQIPHPEVVLRVPASEEHAGQSQQRTDEVHEQHRLAAELEQDDIDPVHHPTEPSRETCSSFWASTANSIGRRERTSRA